MHKSVAVHGEKLSSIIDAMPFDTVGVIASKTGVSRETVSRWKNTKQAHISAGKFPKLAEALGRNPFELLKEIGVISADLSQRQAADSNAKVREKDRKKRKGRDQD